MFTSKKALCIFVLGGCIAFLSFAKHAQTAVPQNIGFKDVKFEQLKKPVCVTCHGDDLVGTHHGTKNATDGNCIFCHKVDKAGNKVGIKLYRDCEKCHEKRIKYKENNNYSSLNIEREDGEFNEKHIFGIEFKYFMNLLYIKQQINSICLQQIVLFQKQESLILTYMRLQ